MSNEIQLSVVMPAYNEEGTIEEAVREVQQVVLDTVGSAEFIVVDDGSKDATSAILAKLAASDQRLHVITQVNQGHGPALRNGIEHATGAFIFLIDSDRQIPIEAFNALWAEAPDHDLVMGVRVQRHDPPSRLLLTKVVKGALQALFGVDAKDANVPFKILKSSLWQKAREFIPADTLAPSLFLAVFALRKAAAVVEITVPHRERPAGTSSIKHMKLIRFCLKAFKQLGAFRRTISQ